MKRGDLPPDHHGAGAGLHHEAPSVGGIEQPVEEEAQGCIGNMDPQMIGGVVLQRMGFVKDHGAVNGQGAVFLHLQFPDLQVRKEQRMIGHHDISLIPGLPVLPVKTLVVERTLWTETVRRFTADALPEHGVKPERDLGLAAGLGAGRPRTEFLHIVIQQHRGQHFRAVTAVGRQIQAPLAEIIAAPFGENECEVKTGQIFQQRQVLVDQLFLQCDRFRGDQHRSPGGAGMVDRRDKIRKTFSDARRRFHAEIVIFFQRFRHRHCHGFLLDPPFVGAAAELGSPFQRGAVREKLLRPDNRIGPDFLQFFTCRHDHGSINSHMV